MAESDIMLVSIKLDADGAIQKTEILDTKFKSLGASMQKGKTRTEGMTEAQEKFTKATRIDTLVKLGSSLIGYRECGCNKRKAWLNKQFPYKINKDGNKHR